MQVFGLDHACHCFSCLMVNSSKLPASGSNIIAFAESYNRSSYYLAARTNKILLHPDGYIIPEGFSFYSNYYKDLIDGSVLRRLKITCIKEGGFIRYMKSIGKLGGQNKVPRLSNDRKVANKLISIN